MSEEQARRLAELLNEKQKRDLILLAQILQEKEPGQRRAGEYERVIGIYQP